MFDLNNMLLNKEIIISTILTILGTISIIYLVFSFKNYDITYENEELKKYIENNSER